MLMYAIRGRILRMRGSVTVVCRLLIHDAPVRCKRDCGGDGDSMHSEMRDKRVIVLVEACMHDTDHDNGNEWGLQLESAAIFEYDKRVRALRKRLTLDFRPLKDTLSKGLEVLIDPEAAVYCTATVEAFCDALFNAIIKDLHEETATGIAPLDTKITVYHIQVALRSHADFAQLLESVESAALVLEYFLDDTTSKALYDRHLIATRDAKHLRAATDDSTGEEELIRMHERTRAEW
ncbi:hypothetical protein FI667_g9154, partial [Globisporangium splendens]